MWPGYSKLNFWAHLPDFRGPKAVKRSSYDLVADIWPAAGISALAPISRRSDLSYSPHRTRIWALLTFKLSIKACWLLGANPFTISSSDTP